MPSVSWASSISEYICSDIERGRLQNVIRRFGLIFEPQLGGFAAKFGAGQDREIENLNFRLGAELGEKFDPPANRIDRIARQAEDQIEPHANAFRHQRANAALPSVEIHGPAHQPMRKRFDRLQADFQFREIRRPQKLRLFARRSLPPAIRRRKSIAARDCSGPEAAENRRNRDAD